MMRALVICLLGAPPQSVAARDPPVPPGHDPGGAAVGLFTTGIDYREPEIARRLARDGEGEIIGWDIVDNDNRPYGSAVGETALAKLLVGSGNVRLVPLRVDPADPPSLARAVAFLARTPARVAVVPMGSARRADWGPFRHAAAHFKEILFVVAAGGDGKDRGTDPTYPAALGLDNVMVVAARASAPPRGGGGPNFGLETVDAVVATVPGAGQALPAGSRVAAVQAVATYFGCRGASLAGASGRDNKRRFLTELAMDMPGEADPVIEPCPARP